MKLLVMVHATVYKVKQNEMQDRQTGQTINWYQVILDQGDDVGTFTCSENVYLNARRGAECDLYAEFDDQNKRFKVVDIVPNSDADMPRPSADSFINAGIPADNESAAPTASPELEAVPEPDKPTGKKK